MRKNKFFVLLVSIMAIYAPFASASAQPEVALEGSELSIDQMAPIKEAENHKKAMEMMERHKKAMERMEHHKIINNLHKQREFLDSKTQEIIIKKSKAQERLEKQEREFEMNIIRRLENTIDTDDNSFAGESTPVLD